MNGGDRPAAELNSQAVGCPQVIGVLEGDDPAVRQLQPAVAGGRRASILLEYIADRYRRRYRQFGYEDLPRRIRRAIIHHNNLVRRQGLLQHAPNRLGQETLTVVSIRE